VVVIPGFVVSGATAKRSVAFGCLASSAVVVVIVVEVVRREAMRFGHEKLDVYQLSVDYVAWAHTMVKDLGGVDRHARDQWLRASQSIALNIAEGTNADRRRYFEIARGSALECAAIEDSF
jgi:hypothetical protein